ncbi:MAG: hypothetical protein JJ863_08515 [Deltaproteobacteria bacterium]|nr:hypothetical protein [Deltaproteobacteria bacterium]
MRLLSIALMVGLAACDCGGGSDDPTSDAGPLDGGQRDSGASDDDAGSSDLGAEEDLGSPDDLGADPEDAGAECTFLDDPMIASCSGGYTYIRRWFATEGDCPDYWTIGGGGRFETEELALASRDCTPECTRRAGTSVSLIRCGVRTGYIVYDDPDCDEAVETPDGIFPTVDDWNAAHPCE